MAGFEQLAMKLGLGLYRHMLVRENFQFARQAGATHIVAHLVDYFKAGAHNPADNQPTGTERGWGLAGDSEKLWALEELIAFNEKHKDREMPWFGQETLIRAQAKGPLTEQPYLEALEKCRRLSRTEGIDAVMDQHKLDALVAPSGGPAPVTDLVHGGRSVGGSSGAAAIAGYPSITVPAGEASGLPLGLSFFGRAWSEPVLLKIAYGFEQAVRARRTPRFLPTVV